MAADYRMGEESACLCAAREQAECHPCYSWFKNLFFSDRLIFTESHALSISLRDAGIMWEFMVAAAFSGRIRMNSSTSRGKNTTLISAAASLTPSGTAH